MQSRWARLGLVGALVVVAVVLFVVLSGGDDDRGDSTPAETTTTTGETGATTQTVAEEPAVEVIRIETDAPVGGVQRLTYRKGDRVRLRVIPDAGVNEIHVHGYELERETDGATPVSFSFVADIDGIFELEAHASAGDFQLAELEVRP